MKRTILVTGGAGYVGSHLVPLLLQRGHVVRVIDSDLYASPTVAHLRSQENCTFIKGDIRHIEDLAPAIRGVDAVVDLAAIVGDEACEKDRDAAETINMNATELLLGLCQRYDVQNLVFASTCSVYGAKPKDWLEEHSATAPLSLYAETKLESERILLGARGETSPQVTVLRLATVFGLSRRMRFDLVLNFFAARAATGEPLIVYGGDQVRPLVHAHDVARAFLMVLDAPGERIEGQVLNVGSNEQNLTIADLAEQVAKTSPTARVERRSSETDPRNYRVRFDKIREFLGFETEIDIQEGAREIIQAIQSKRIQDYLDDRYYNVRYAYKNS